MTLRPTQASTYQLVRHGLALNFGKLARAQEQVASGKRILRPSDDAMGTSVALSLRRQAGNVSSFKGAAAAIRPFLEATAGALEESSRLLTEARAFVLQGINGTLDQDNRNTIANQIAHIRQSLLENANSRSGDRFIFGGTQTTDDPFLEQTTASGVRVFFRGNEDHHRLLIGRNVEVAANIPGTEVFDRFEGEGTSFVGPTGAAPGASASSGRGYHHLVVRHDSTVGLGEGIASAAGGAEDTIVGDHLLVIDATARTARLGTGELIPLPDPASAEYLDFEVADADGSEMHLDLSAWSGLDFSGTITGSASVALNGGSFQSLDLAQTDLQLVDEETQTVLHVDATGITRSGADLVTFRGAANIFDTLQGIVEDLQAGEELGGEALAARMGERLAELDRNSTNVLAGLGQIGARMERIGSTESRLEEVELHLKGLISKTEDADLSNVVLELSRAETTLQVAQATGARLLQQTLLNYLR